MAVKLPPGLKAKKKYKVDMQMRRMNWVQVCLFVHTYICTSGDERAAMLLITCGLILSVYVRTCVPNRINSH